MHQVKENVKNFPNFAAHFNRSADQKRSALRSKCAAKFGKVEECAAGAKSLRTTGVAYADSRILFHSKMLRRKQTRNLKIFDHSYSQRNYHV